MCNKPSTPSASSTNAPKAVIRATLPVTVAPTLKLLDATTHGSLFTSFKEREIFSLSLSALKTVTSTSCPTVKISDAFLTLDQASSEMCTKPSTPPKSMNAPKSTRRDTLPLTLLPSVSVAKTLSLTSLDSCAANSLRDAITRLLEASTSMIWKSYSLPLKLDKSLTK